MGTMTIKVALQGTFFEKGNKGFLTVMNVPISFVV